MPASIEISSDSDCIDSSEEESQRFIKDKHDRKILTWQVQRDPTIKDYNARDRAASASRTESQRSHADDKADFVLVWKNDPNSIHLIESFMEQMTGKGLIFKTLIDISSTHQFAEVFATPDALKINAVNFQLCLPIQKCSYLKKGDSQYLRVKFDKNALSLCTPNNRAIIVYSIMNRFHCTDSSRLETLLTDGTFYAAFQPHDIERRNPLYDNWASMKNFFRVLRPQQPLSEIREYFGDKIVLYFAWLNFYTLFLLVASIFSLAFFFFGLTLDDSVADQICNKEDPIIMCPLCDKCNYWTLNNACKKYRFSSAMVNEATVFLNLIMLVITPLFLKLWKRYCSSLAHKWNLSSFNVKGEPERPEYVAKIETQQHNEPVEIIKIVWKVGKGLGLFLFFILVIAVVIGGVIYQEHLKTSISRWCKEGVTSLLSSLLKTLFTYCLIYGLNFVYEYIAESMTEHQCLRTQTQHDNSLTILLVAFAFITKYANIFFIVLVKGNFTGTPNDNHIFNYRLTECGYGGCLLDLIILLASMKAVYTILDPMKKPLRKWIKSIDWWQSLLNFTLIHKRDEKISGEHRYIKDTNLQEFSSRDFLNMNLERILNFAIVTIFVPVFPLAPIVALIYTLYTTRTDAKELLDDHRRPIFLPARDIGVFYGFLHKIQYIAIVTQGYINAFIYDLVPQFVYRFFYSPNRSLEGYVEFTLSKFKTANHTEYLPKTSLFNVTQCSYRDYRNDPGTEFEYERNIVYWHILAARLIFLLVFVALGLIIISLVNVCIKDKPKKLRKLVKQRNMYETYNGYYLNAT